MLTPRKATILIASDSAGFFCDTLDGRWVRYVLNLSGEFVAQ